MGKSYTSKEIKDRILKCIQNNELLISDYVNIFSQLMFEGKIDNKQLVNNFEEIRDYLNLQTITSFSEEHECSYNGVKFKKNLRTSIKNTEYIVDND